MGSDRQGKQTARAAASIALIALSAWTGGAAAGLSGLAESSLGYALIETGVSVAVVAGGTYAINRLIPLPDDDITDQGITRLGSLTGSQNRINKYGAVPVVYGKRRIYPPMSAQPYTEIVANWQYMRLLFCLGPGPLKLSSPKIGNTTIGGFDENNNFTTNDNFDDIEIDVAEEPSLYTSSVQQTSPGVGLDELGDSAVRTTEEGVHEAAIEITFPLGLFIREHNETRSTRVRFKIEYRETGTSTWENVFFLSDRSWVNFPPVFADGERLFEAFGSIRETYRGGLRFRFPEQGQYDIRITRETKGDLDEVDEEDAIVRNGANWTALKSITHEKPTNLPGIVQIGMRIRATDQFNGVLDNFSVVAERELPFYDGAWNVPA